MSDEQKSNTGLVTTLAAAVLAAAGASGISIYMSPGAEMARDPSARPDAYTGSMHKQYAETIDARFESVYRAIGENARRLDDMKHEHKEIEQRQHAYYQSVLSSMDRIYSALVEKHK